MAATSVVSLHTIIAVVVTSVCSSPSPTSISRIPLRIDLTKPYRLPVARRYNMGDMLQNDIVSRQGEYATPSHDIRIAVRNDYGSAQYALAPHMLACSCQVLSAMETEKKQCIAGRPTNTTDIIQQRAQVLRRKDTEDSGNAYRRSTAYQRHLHHTRRYPLARLHLFLTNN